MCALDVISPITITYPVVVQVSQATRLIGSCSSSASRIASEMASQILSGCPSVTDSEVNSLFSILFLLFFLLFSFAFRSWALAFPEHFFVKKDPQFLADLNSNVQIPLLFENFAQAGTFPYRPFCLGVAVVSQILCISTTLNKRKATEFLILFFVTLIHYRKIRHSSRGNKRI